jgi:hypothetical protein
MRLEETVHDPSIGGVLHRGNLFACHRAHAGVLRGAPGACKHVA